MLPITKIYNLLILLLFASVFNKCEAQRIRHNKQGPRFLGYGNVASDGGQGSAGLWPSVFNVAAKAKIEANATCGESTREEFCKMIDHHHRSRSPQCGVCDSKSADSAKRHHISYAIDGSTRWWQSPTLQKGPQFEYVTISLDLGQIYQIAYVIVKAANSPRPASWILERSLDGITYSAWQYYASSDEECITKYGLDPTPGKPKYKGDSEIICTSFYSKINPLENGEIHTSLLNGRPGANDSSAELLEFTLARYVRMRFQRIRTLASSDSPGRWIPGPSEHARAKRHFYSIRDLNIGGQCVCSGHATSCRHNVAAGHPECECLHNTCGSNCDRCCPLFNQFPFRAGTVTEANICERCQCNGHAPECVYDPLIEAEHQSMDTKGFMRGGGVCVNCTKFTTGINCEKCLPGFYRPLGTQPDDDIPCLPCDCDLSGSTGFCDGSNNSPGQCQCLPGFTGSRCERCALGHRGPRCEQCSCDLRGTMPGGECETPCQCKLHVEGSHCDTCQSGYFSLRAEHAEGCLPCYCSGVGATCRPAEIEASSFETVEGWSVTDISATDLVFPVVDADTGLLIIGNYELPNIEAYYWLAPKPYAGNKLNSYGSRLIFNVGWVVMRGDTSGKMTTGPNIILVGKNGLKIAYGDVSYGGENITMNILLKEDHWYHVPKSVKDIVTRLRRTEYRGDPVNRVQFMSVLSDIKHILLRAKFHTDQVEGSLERAVLYAGGNEIQENNFNMVEQCDCPPGYTGLSCELCAYGYVRIMVNTTVHIEQGKCIKCDCNGHAPSCDIKTGKCATCEHNTLGEKCERCAAGFYGNPIAGKADDCKPCACPLLDIENNFSPSCQVQVVNFGLESGNEGYVCTQCPEGYIGDHCEICDDGYYGNPLILGSSCEPCPCDGNPCNPATGECITCSGNTEGWRCERCKPNYFGNPEDTCEPCDCYGKGSIQNTCDPANGQCICANRFAGRRCDQCDIGFGNISNDCSPCACDELGSENMTCDRMTGQCRCKPGVGGHLCDTCVAEFYGLSEDGCEGCSCNALGSSDSKCDIVTGQCPCRDNVTGKTCNKCKHGYWNIASGRGCLPCVCDPLGCSDGSCDLQTGDCLCKPGVTGSKCDECAAGYFGFSNKGCKPCDLCISPGHVCNPDTGHCECPPLSHGDNCQRCYTNAWGNELTKGCKACNCHRSGSVRGQCDLNRGECLCKDGFAGLRCDKCATGYYGFPNCRRCQCDLHGTIPTRCDSSGLCDCDENGQCPCKEKVSGKKCDICHEGTFGLSSYNEDGCTPCFCFGRTTKCSQASGTWGDIKISSPRNVSLYQNYYASSDSVKLLDTVLKKSQGLDVIPWSASNATYINEFKLTAPIYWELPQQFLGDHVLSYGGFLNFISTTSIIDSYDLFNYKVLRQFPLVQLQAHGQLVLEYYEIQTPSLGPYNIRFHASLWQNRYNPHVKVSRDLLMVALQNITNILLRASPYSNFKEVILEEASMNTGIMIPAAIAPIATEVEICECPSNYTSTSCQDPSLGFYRHKWPSSQNATIIIELVGEAQKCRCNDRSETCEMETGHCQNCRLNTTGPHCDICAEGFYGDPFVSECAPCPCPEPGRNFAKSCKLEGKQLLCQCKQGYTGRRCDRCSVGYFGGPSKPAGSCEPCSCHPEGRSSEECDDETGICKCKPGVTGKDCSMCELPRHELKDYTCQPCDNCTQILFNLIDDMSYTLLSETAHVMEPLPAPIGQLLDFKNQTDLLRQDLNDFIITRDQVNAIPNDKYDKLHNKASKLKHKLNKLISKQEKVGSEIFDLENNVHTFLNNDLRPADQQIQDSVETLHTYLQKDHHINVERALKDAERLLKDIEAISFKEQRNNVVDALRNAKILYLKANSPHFKKHLQEINELETKLKDLNLFDKLEYLENKTSDATDIIEQVEKFQNIHATKFKEIKRKMDEINTVHKYIKEKSNHTLPEEAQVKLDEYKDNLDNIRAMHAEMKEKAQVVNKTENIQNRLGPLYKEKHLNPAIRHAETLFAQAKEYEELFSKTKNNVTNALDASMAYERIANAIAEARLAAINATEAVKRAHMEVYPLNQHSKLDLSYVANADSSRLKERALQKTKSIEPLENKLKSQNKIVDSIKSKIWQVGVDNNNIINEIEALNKSKTNTTFAEAIDKAYKTSENMKALIKETMQIKDQIMFKDKPFIKANFSDDTQVGGAKEQVDEARTKMKNIDERITALSDRMLKPDTELSVKIKDLMAKVAQAKHVADGIHHLSLTRNESTCIRSYKPINLVPSTTTSIVLVFAVPKGVSDSSLIYLPGAREEFIALELVATKVRFSWNLGSDTVVITHPEVLEAKDEKNDDEAWYRIEANRISNVGYLYVRKQLGSSNRTATNASSPYHTRLDITPSTQLWIGGTPPGQHRPNELLADNGLTVNLHRVSIDGKQIGLWNFVNPIENSKCGSGMEGAIEKCGDLKENYFNGEGYAIGKIPSRKYKLDSFKIQFQFKTLDEDSLLFLATDTNHERWISLYLEEGYVTFAINYGELNILKIKSAEKFNNGNWILVEATRHFNQKVPSETGKLRVGDTSPQFGSPSSPITSTSLPNLTNAKYYIGGVPPGFNSEKYLHYLSTKKSFLGYIKDINVYGEGYNPLVSVYYGVESSCSEKPHTMVGYNGEGYLELPSYSLHKNSSFEFVFRSLKPNALLLLAAHEPQKDLNDELANSAEVTTKSPEILNNYYSVSLENGKIVVFIKGGAKEIRLYSNMTLNDGLFHAVYVLRHGKKVELRIDDELQKSLSLQAKGNVITAPGKSGGMFLGGLPKGLNNSKMAASNEPFVGAIKDLTFNQEIIIFNNPVYFTKVEIGRLGPDIGPDNSVNPISDEPMGRSYGNIPEGCHKVGSYSLEPYAAKFGDGLNSHAEVLVRNIWQRDFTLEFDFRTFYPNGLLFVVPANKPKQRHYLIVTLQNGLLSLLIKGNKKRELSLPVNKLNDGNWHHVILSTIEKKATLSIDGRTSAQLKLPKRVNVANMMYVGGLPADGHRLPENVAHKLEGFKGCIRSLNVNNQSQDIVLSGKHNNVRQCFPNIEKGSYFSGDGFAIYKNNFFVGKILELQLEFKTSEITGILLSVAEASGSPALSLEVNNGKVIMSVDLGDRNPFSVEAVFPGKHSLCDNRWHNITALFDSEELVIRVDHLKANSTVRTRGYRYEDASINSSLYIGGLPYGAPIGTLQTRDNFKGCIRNVAIGGQAKDWSDMDALHNILLSSCPVIH